MTEAQIKHMVDRFLSWKLPQNFNPDGGVSFKATFNEHTAHPMKHEPSGTNLFDAVQATEMVRYMLEGLPLDLHPKSDALMPCPFCGGEAEMDTQRSYAHLASPHRLGTQVAIYCLACSADIAEDPREIGVSIEDSIYAVRERWNARTSSCDPSTIMAQFDRAIAAIKAA